MPAPLTMRSRYRSPDGWLGIVWEMMEHLRSQDPGANEPIITHGQAIAMLESLHEFARMSSITFPGWPDLWYEHLGHLQPNDKFVMTGAHAGTYATPDLSVRTWQALTNAAVNFDRIMGSAPVAADIDESWGAYRRAAYRAWQKMLADRLKAGVKPPPNPFPKIDGTGVLLGLIALYLLTRKKGN